MWCFCGQKWHSCWPRRDVKGAELGREAGPESTRRQKLSGAVEWEVGVRTPQESFSSAPAALCSAAFGSGWGDKLLGLETESPSEEKVNQKAGQSPLREIQANAANASASRCALKGKENDGLEEESNLPPLPFVGGTPQLMVKHRSRFVGQLDDGEGLLWRAGGFSAQTRASRPAGRAPPQLSTMAVQRSAEGKSPLMPQRLFGHKEGTMNETTALEPLHSATLQQRRSVPQMNGDGDGDTKDADVHLASQVVLGFGGQLESHPLESLTSSLALSSASLPEMGFSDGRLRATANAYGGREGSTSAPGSGGRSPKRHPLRNCANYPNQSGERGSPVRQA